MNIKIGTESRAKDQIIQIESSFEIDLPLKSIKMRANFQVILVNLYVFFYDQRQTKILHG